ncbi:MAG: DUF4373 domain-containing protein [Prevotella sp.]|nr:DUF4373 domain-containing protein [Prevotella sp.]
MARPKKQGLDSFPIDVDIFDDERMLVISKDYGIAGEYVAMRLLCAIYKNGYYIDWNKDMLLKLYLSIRGVTEEMIENIVNSLVERGFFDKDMFELYHILTSKEIQTTYFSKTRRRISLSDLPYLIYDDDESFEDIVMKKKMIKKDNSPKKGQELLHTETPLMYAETPENKEKKKQRKEPKENKEIKERQQQRQQRAREVLSSVEDEVVLMGRDENWLSHIMALLKLRKIDVGKDELSGKLQEFYLHCVCSGFTHHENYADAQKHFCLWLQKRYDPCKKEKSSEMISQQQTACLSMPAPVDRDAESRAFEEQCRRDKANAVSYEEAKKRHHFKNI